MYCNKHRVVLFVVALGLAPLMGQSARAEVTTNVRVPLDTTVFVPCAADGAGEVVVLAGTLHLLVRVTLDPLGGVHAGMHSQMQGVSGFGMTTGALYRASGVTQDKFNDNTGLEQTFIHNLRVVGQGSGNNFLVHELVHVTVNSNFEVTATVDNLASDCR